MQIISIRRANRRITKPAGKRAAGSVTNLGSIKHWCPGAVLVILLVVAALLMAVAVRGTTMVMAVIMVAHVAHDVTVFNLFLGALATGCAYCATDAGTDSSAYSAADHAADYAARHSATCSTGSSTAHVVITIVLSSVSSRGATGATDASTDSSTYRAANSSTYDATGHGTTGTARCFIGLIVAHIGAARTA